MNGVKSSNYDTFLHFVRYSKEEKFYIEVN